MEETKFVFLVEIDKSVGLKEAKRLARKTLRKIRTPTYVETDSIYRFKNIPRAYFDLTSFKTHQSTPTMKLIYGSLLQKEDPETQRLPGFFEEATE